MGSRPQDVWLHENTKLCNAVREFPCLYDRKDEAFMGKDACDAAWEQISNKCNITDAKCRWRNIRTAFSRSNFSQRRNTQNKYYLASALDWLLPHMPGNLDSDAGTTQDEDSMPSTSNHSANETSKRNASTDKDPLAEDELSQVAGATENEADADRRSRYTRACKRTSSSKSPLKEAESQQQSPQETTPKRRRIRKTLENKKEMQPLHIPREKAEVTARSTERSRSPSVKPAKTDADIKSVKQQTTHEPKETPNGSNGRAASPSPSSSQLKSAEIDSFFQTVNPYILDMNKRQFLHFKKKIFGAIMEVFDDPKGFPDGEEALVNPSPRSLIFENVTAKEHYLMRELVSTVISTKGSSTADAASSPAEMPAPVLAMPLPDENVVPKLSEKASPDLPTSSTVIQVQPGSADAAKSGRNLYVLNSPSPRQQVPTNVSPPGLTGKVVRLGNGNIDPNSPVYRIVQKIPPGSVVVSKATHPSQSPVNTFTIPYAATTSTFSNSSTVITSTSNLAGTPGSIASGSSLLSLRAMSSLKPQQPQPMQQQQPQPQPQQHQQMQLSQPSTVNSRSILSMTSPGKVGLIRRNSMAGLLPSRLERRASTIVGGNMSHLVPGSMSNMAVSRYAAGMPGNRAVRTITPIRAQGRAENSAIITRPTAAERMPAPSGYGPPPMARSSPNTVGAVTYPPARRGRPPGATSSMQVIRNSPIQMSPLVGAEKPSPLQILEAENSISLDIKHEPEDP